MNMVTFVIGLIFVPCLSMSMFISPPITSPVPHPVPHPVPRPLTSPVPHHRPCMVTAGLVCHDLIQYRSQNGECNNLKNPRWGAAMTAFKRLLPNSYQNKISLPRYLKTDSSPSTLFPTIAQVSPLPNARTVSRMFFPQSQNPESPWQQSPQSPQRTNMASVFGQFLTHDIILTLHDGNEVCDDRCSDLTTECFGITIANTSNDPVFTECIPMTRASRCKFKGVQEQINSATAFIDASQVYGNNEEEVERVRDMNSLNGLLRTTCHNEAVKPLLPQLQADDPKVFCRSYSSKTPCFYTGDYKRNNVSPALAAMHTIWVREHNRIALELREINPHWDKERLFQETRKIIGAMMQHISYSEYLPTILSKQMLQDYELNPNQPWKYDQFADASIANSFGAAALRFGHSTVGNMYTRPDFFDMPIDDMHNPTPLYNLQQGGVDSILNGMLEQSARKIDRFFSWALTMKLKPGPGVTADLVAINIQRGRDHGLPPYVKFRDHFNVSTRSIPNELKSELINLYGDLDDVDLYVGGLLETPVADGAMGPTFSHILAEGFKNLRKGDRFWYQNLDSPSGFNSDQLKEIKKASLAKIICDNSDAIYRIQRMAMLKEGSGNERMPCAQLPYADLSKWRDEGNSLNTEAEGESGMEQKKRRESETGQLVREGSGQEEHDAVKDATLKDVKMESKFFLEQIIVSGTFAQNSRDGEKQTIEKTAENGRVAEFSGTANDQGN